jgi:predicted ATPase
LEKALRGERQLVFVTGESGIGKTALAEAFLEQVEAAGRMRVGRGQCVEHYGAGEAYLPILEALGRLGRGPAGQQLIEVFKRYAPTWLLQLSTLIDDAELDAIQRKVQGATRERMLRELAEAFEVLTAETPVMLLLEDLHWSDYATIDSLSLLAQRREAARLLVIGTYRPAEIAVSDHPLKAAKRELQVHGRCVELALNFLTEQAVADYLSIRFAGASLPSALARMIHRGTDGNALFMVNIVDELVTQGALERTAEGWSLTAPIEQVAISGPESLRQMIEKQIERLSEEQQQLLEVASVGGAEFSAAMVAAGLESATELAEIHCEELVRRGQFFQALGFHTLPDGTTTGRYGFLHALYQTVLYERLSTARRMRLHRRIGESQERFYGNRAGEIATELAMHFVRGQDVPRALTYLQKAAENALRRSAYREAITHVTGGLEMLLGLPDTPERNQAELAFRIMLGTALITTKGYAAPEVEQVFARARELCALLGENPQLIFALSGLARFYLVRGSYTTSLELAKQTALLAHQQKNPGLLLEIDLLLGLPLLYLGNLRTAQDHLEQCIARYDPQQHNGLTFIYGQDPGVVSHAHETWPLWLCGYADQALTRAREALSLARENGFRINEAIAYHFLALTHQFRRENRAAQEAAAAEVAVSTEQGFPFWRAMGMITQGGALLAEGQGQEGIALMRQGLEAHRATGAEIGNTYWIALLAEGYGKIGQVDAGLATLNDAFATMRKNNERWWEAELHRLQGWLMLQQFKVQSSKFKVANPQALTPNLQTEAEACFLKAIESARHQQAKSLELRAAMSLSRLWRGQGKSAEAQGLLAEVYNWFTEGFDTGDLQEAKTLLEELRNHIAQPTRESALQHGATALTVSPRVHRKKPKTMEDRQSSSVRRK